MEDRFVQKGFEFFYRKKYKTNNYLFFFTENSKKIYDKFKEEISTELSVDFLWRYLLFQFSYWEELNVTQVSSISFSHIFGNKAILRFRGRNAEYDWQLYSDQLVQKLKIKKKEYYKYINYSPYLSVFTNNSDPIKLRFLNTEEGYSTCLELTTLYNEQDSSCQRCNFKLDCKELLLLNYPKIYKSRYGGGKK